MKALLVRVGIDSSKKSGGWNAPVDPVTYEFAYVPILEQGEVIPEYKRTYEQFKAICKKLGNPLPPKFMNKYTYAHLDPDFSYLTYGDERKRGKRIRELEEDDIVAFYAGLRSTEPERNLIYALIGLYVVDKIISAKLISEKDRDKNAHTRKQPDKTDVIVFAKPGLSGRLERCIPIGENRSKAYRVTCGLLGEWGGLCVKNGFIQRSGTLPWFCNPEKFYKWFRNQNIRLVKCNNPLATGD
jgi:hypothetical protein